VDIRYVDYGGVDGVAYLDDDHSVGIWNSTIYLLEALGWEVGKNLRGAPYDWRFGPETFAAQDWPRLRALFEETYALNNNSKGKTAHTHDRTRVTAHTALTAHTPHTPEKRAVAAVSLSMGGPYFLAFLNQQTQAWKDKYLHSFVSFDGAFGGSPSATSALISTSGTPTPPPKHMRA
jgi:lysophospholipase-3